MRAKSLIHVTLIAVLATGVVFTIACKGAEEPAESVEPVVTTEETAPVEGEVVEETAPEGDGEAAEEGDATTEEDTGEEAPAEPEGEGDAG